MLAFRRNNLRLAARDDRTIRRTRLQTRRRNNGRHSRSEHGSDSTLQGPAAHSTGPSAWCATTTCGAAASSRVLPRLLPTRAPSRPALALSAADRGPRKRSQSRWGLRCQAARPNAHLELFGVRRLALRGLALRIHLALEVRRQSLSLASRQGERENHAWEPCRDGTAHQRARQDRRMGTVNGMKGEKGTRCEHGTMDRRTMIYNHAGDLHRRTADPSESWLR